MPPSGSVYQVLSLVCTP